MWIPFHSSSLHVARNPGAHDTREDLPISAGEVIPWDGPGWGGGDGLPPRIGPTRRSGPVPLNWARGCGTIMAGRNRPVLTKQRSGGNGAKFYTKTSGRTVAFDFECVT